MQRIAACLVLALAASSAFAQSSYWKDGRGHRVPDTESNLKVVAPTGKPLIDQKDLDCYAGPIAGSAYNMRLSKPVIEFSASPGEPAGIWSAEVMLRDIVRGVELPLRTTFRLE